MTTQQNKALFVDKGGLKKILLLKGNKLSIFYLLIKLTPFGCVIDHCKFVVFIL
jgi:hypothetical protein